MKQPKQTRRIEYGIIIIEYELIFSKRKTLGIHIHPDTRVIVRAPLGCDPRLVEEHLRNRAAWIFKHQQHFRQNLPAEQPMHVNGARVRYLGERYMLQVEASHRERVQLGGGNLIVSVRDVTNSERVTVLMDRWLRVQAKRVFAERLTACFARVESWGVALPPLKIRDMKTRWGSCSSKGNLSLNLRLIHQPVELIDYVVLHELCHLKELNHSPGFWKLMDRVLPDWRERRKRLNYSPMKGEL